MRGRAAGAGTIWSIGGNMSLREQELGRVQLIMLAKETCLIFFFFLLQEKRGKEYGDRKNLE